jgi:hypothetical protein
MKLLTSVVGSVRRALGRWFPLPDDGIEIARYVVLAESTFGFTVPDPSATVPLSDRHFRGIDAPGVLSGSRPVIYYRTSHTGNPSFSVRLNGTRLTQNTFAHGGQHSWHEIIPSHVLKAEGNELTFSVDGQAWVRFSDVVILYTSNQVSVT